MSASCIHHHPVNFFVFAFVGARKTLSRNVLACETFRACPDCGGDVGAVEDAPSDASSDVDLPPLRNQQRRRLGLVSDVRTST
jgi:hypothetical protein